MDHLKYLAGYSPQITAQVAQNRLGSVIVQRDFRWKILMSLAVALFAFLRQPELLLQPRFWAEEGASYFSFAHDHSLLATFFSAQYGYYTLYNSIATALAALVPLDYAPAVTTYLAFAVQVAVSLAAIWWPIPLLDSLVKKFVMALAIQYLAYSRLWVTTIGIQYWLCISSFLLLISDGEGRHARYRNLLLLHNGLTGVLTCFLIPSFAVKAYRQRSREFAVNTMVLVGCLIVQLATFVSAVSQPNPQMSSRFGQGDGSYVVSKVIKHEFTVPFFGQYLTNPKNFLPVEDALFNFINKATNNLFADYNFSFLETIPGVCALVFVTVACFYLKKESDFLAVVLSIVILTVLSTAFSVNMSGGPRYAFAPSIMMFIVVVWAMRNRSLPLPLRHGATLLVAASLILSLRDYRPMMQLAYDPSWPKWRDELAGWRMDDRYAIRIWPPGWTMTLRK